jgi:hypothetical protein
MYKTLMYIKFFVMLIPVAIYYLYGTYTSKLEIKKRNK